MNNTTFRPLLSATIKNRDELAQLRYPMIASPKLDGIRVLIHPQLGAVTRKLKPVPNRFVRAALERASIVGFDGEVVVGSPIAKDVFNVTSSAVMSFEGEPQFRFFAFDNFVNPALPYTERLKSLHVSADYVSILEHQSVQSVADVLALETAYLSKGYEGIMLRSPTGPYKFNRSTLKEQILIKLKTFVDADATVVGVEQLYKNANELEADERGYAKRSQRQDGLVPLDTLGALVCRSDEFADVFKIGSGFTQAQRDEIWRMGSTVVGRQIKFKYQDIGVKDRPRFPVFLGWRLD